MRYDIEDNPMKWDAVVERMVATEQASGMDILQHGLRVADKFLEIFHHLKGDRKSENLKIPESILENSKFILSKLCPISDVINYLIYHDMGKPNCKIIDQDGKIHFPDHAKVSGRLAERFCQTLLVSDLISMDMDIHQLKSDGVEEFSKRPEAMTLILAGLAEIHSNADMFGGIDSTGFKIKYKQIDRKSKQILNNIIKN